MLDTEFYLYILECSDNSYYIGHTDNLEKRISEHASGASEYTRMRLPIILKYSERFATRDEAFVAERKLKGWSCQKNVLRYVRLRLNSALCAPGYAVTTQDERSRDQVQDDTV